MAYSMDAAAELRPMYRPAAKEKALRLRGAIELDDRVYDGKSSSRKAIFEDDALHASSTGPRCAWPSVS